MKRTYNANQTMQTDIEPAFGLYRLENMLTIDQLWNLRTILAAATKTPGFDKEERYTATEVLTYIDDLIGSEPDDTAEGIAWWNAQSPSVRTYWMQRAGNTGIAADAWEAYKQHTQFPLP